MQTLLGNMFENARRERGLSRQALAARLGYTNVNKGARRLERLERDGIEPDDFVVRVARVLGIDHKKVADLAARDEAVRRAEFAEWGRGPQPRGLIRFVAGVAVRTMLPDGLSDKAAIEYAERVHRMEGLRGCLLLDRRRSVWFDSDGARMTEAAPGWPNMPFTTVG